MSKSKEKKPAKGTRTFYIRGIVHKDITPKRYKELMAYKLAATPVKK